MNLHNIERIKRFSGGSGLQPAEKTDHIKCRDCCTDILWTRTSTNCWTRYVQHFSAKFIFFYIAICILAAKIAEFASVELLNQNTAIAISYRKIHKELAGIVAQNVAVLSIGAQTTEVNNKIHKNPNTKIPQTQQKRPKKGVIK